jgi:hypothetical protein
MPEPNIARGNVLRGSRTSSLIVETSSKPANANAICGQKFTVFQSQCGQMLLPVNCVTEPCRCQIMAATRTKIIKGRKVDTPPAFCSHFPMRNPMMFMNTATNRSTKEPISRNVRFCASGA